MHKSARSLAIGTLAAAAMVGMAPMASAATSPRHAIPNSGCTSSDWGPWTDTQANGGAYYRSNDAVHSDHNGTAYTATDQFQNTWSGTQSATISAGASITISELIASVKIDVNASATSSETVSGTHTVTFTIAPHSTLYAQYGSQYIDVNWQHYNLSATCSPVNETTGSGSVPLGQGWNTWTGP